MSDKYEAHRNDPPAHAGKPLGGTGGDTGWSVEARLAYHAPKTVAGMLLDDRWQTVRFNDHAITGVPTGGSFCRWQQMCGLYTYSAAQALRWWFIATARVTFDDLCLETRLVRHAIKYQYSYTAEEACDCIGGEDRSHMKPEPPTP